MTARIGAHLNATPRDDQGGRAGQADILRRMGANTFRLQAYWDGYKRFTNDAEVRAFFDATAPGPEAIIQSSEVPDPNRTWDDGTLNRDNTNGIANQWNFVKFWARQYPSRHIVFEIGNEPSHVPEWVNNPVAANQTLMRCYQYCQNNWGPPNIWLAVAQPLAKDDLGYDSWWFDTYNNYHGYGYPIQDVPIQACHIYGGCSYRPGNYGHANDTYDPFRIIRWVRSWKSNAAIKVTEAGLHYNDPYNRDQRAGRFVDLANNLQAWTDAQGGQGYSDSVCIYCVGADPGHWPLEGYEADAIGRREARYNPTVC